MHIKAVADLLGHSSIAITGDIYGHTSDDTARAAVDGWSGVSDWKQPLRIRVATIPPWGIDTAIRSTTSCRPCVFSGRADRI